jgi:hypothetical protein
VALLAARLCQGGAIGRLFLLAGDSISRSENATYRAKNPVCCRLAIATISSLCTNRAMLAWTGKKLRLVACALALMGVLQYAWVLAVHTTSPLLALNLGAGSLDDGFICDGHPGSLPDGGKNAPNDNTDPKTSCPICLGLASLNLAVLSQPLDLVKPRLIEPPHLADVADAIQVERSSRTRNRGPPLSA